MANARVQTLAGYAEGAAWLSYIGCGAGHHGVFAGGISSNHPPKVWSCAAFSACQKAPHYTVKLTSRAALESFVQGLRGVAYGGFTGCKSLK